MARDDRDILDILKFELDFLEHGGYGRSVRTPWKETSIFQDSLTCINFGDPERTRPCDECLLIDFVPKSKQSLDVPCHHIPITERGETVEVIEQTKMRSDVEEAVKNWLRKTINDIETKRARLTTH
jgi:hypothetical protein